MRCTLVAALGAALLLAPAPARAQTAEDKAVLAVVHQVFEGMRLGDSAMVRAAFADGARFAGVDTTGTVRFMPLDGWIRAIANSGGRWQEPIYDVQVRVDGNMAQVWAPYTFYLDGKVSHCGIDAIELLRAAGGWKITQLSDTRRRDNCPDPLKK